MSAATPSTKSFAGIWQSSLFTNRAAWLSLAGTAALLLYAVLRLTEEGLGEFAQRLMILSGFVSLAIYGGRLRKSPSIWLFGAAIAVVLVSWGLSHWAHPEWAERSPKVHRLADWFIFIPIAWWLGGRERNTLTLWVAFLGGLLVSPWMVGGGWAEWMSGLQGVRIDFGVHNAQHTAMLFGVALLGLVTLGHRGFARGPLRWLRRLLVLVSLVACITAVIITQTRGVWLGLLGAAAVMAAVAAYWIIQHSRHKRALKVIFGTLAVVALVAAILGPRVDSFVELRIAGESSTIRAAVEGDMADVPYDSAGIRIHTWVEAWAWIKARPLVGWGGNGRSLIFEHSTALPADVKAGFSHLHNSYLDLLVNFGLLGLALYLTLLGWLLGKSIQAWRAGVLAGDVLSFFLAFLMFWLIINSFESYMFFSSGSFIFSLVCGGILTHIWAATELQTSGSAQSTAD